MRNHPFDTIRMNVETVAMNRTMPGVLPYQPELFRFTTGVTGNEPVTLTITTDYADDTNRPLSSDTNWESAKH